MTELHFLRPGDAEAGHQVLAKICEILRSDKLVYICVAYFTHQDIANEIIERTKKQKTTRLILNLADLLRPIDADSSEFRASAALSSLFTFLGEVRHPYSQHLEMKTLGREKNDISTMHHKFIVGDRQVGFGSMNLTTNSMINNYENFCFSDERDCFLGFAREFEAMWEEAKEMFAPNGKIRVIECPSCGESEGVDFESYGMICTFCFHKFTGVS